MEDGKEIGHIFSPSGSGHTDINYIQICGFSESYDLWGCGIYKGFKDIQLLFDGKKMPGEPTNAFDNCLKCFMEPCQCEVRGKGLIPFTVKSSFTENLKKRIKGKKSGIKLYENG